MANDDDLPIFTKARPTVTIQRHLGEGVDERNEWFVFVCRDRKQAHYILHTIGRNSRVVHARYGLTSGVNWVDHYTEATQIADMQEIERLIAAWRDEEG